MRLQLKDIIKYLTFSHTTPKCPSFPTRPEKRTTRAEISFKVASLTGDVGFTDGLVTGALRLSISAWISERIRILGALRQTIRSDQPTQYRCEKFDNNN